MQKTLKHATLGRLLTKGMLYKCTNVDKVHGRFSMCGVIGDQKFFDEHFEPNPVDITNVLTLTEAETTWLKGFFKDHIDEIADIDGGTDYGSLMTVSDKIDKL